MNTLECKEIIRGLPPVLTEKDSISLDLELSGLRESQLHRPAGRMTSLAGSFDGQTAYIIFEESEVAEFLQRIEKATFVFHNSTFDIAHLRRWATIPERKNMRDTMLIEKVMFSDYYDDFGLNDLVRRYLKCYMPKDVRKEFHNLEGAMTEEQIQYAALDVIGTFLVDKEQQKILEQKDRLIWERIDLPTVWTSIDLSGFTVDVDKWYDIAERNQEIVDRIEYDLGQKYGKNVKKMSGRGKNKVEVDEFVPFNPASPSQVLALLKSQGLDIDSTGDDVIAPYRDANDTVSSILEYRGAAKKVSTYGKSYMKFVENDGKIYPSLNVVGASSGRSSCRAPNLQQVPRMEEYRACFIAGKGNKLIIADYSAQEPRIFAFICKDEKLMEIFNSGKDIYCEVAREAFNEVIMKKDKERRNQIKALVLGLIYGLSPYGFARDNEVSQEVAEEMFNAFFDAFPQAAQWVREQQLVNKGFTRTILGRKCHLHPYNAQWKRNSLNNPMQGCISGEALILSEGHGIVPISNLNGQMISVWDGERFSDASVSYSGKKQKAVMLLQNGQEIVCSPDHKFLTTNSYGSQIWRTTQEISELKGKIWIKLSDEVDDYHAPTSIPEKFPKTSHNSHTESLLNMSPIELGMWVGRLASDGSVGDGSIRLLVAEHEKSILELLVSISSKIFTPRVREIIREDKKPMFTIDLDHSALSKYLVDEGVKFQIPRFITEDKELLRGYLIGMFDGDGTVNKDGAYLTFGEGDRYYNWAKQTLVALSLFGISARINVCADRINVRISKRDMPKFTQEIGFINEVKQNKSEKISSMSAKNDWGSIYGKSISVKSVTITDEYIHMYDVVDSDTERFMVDGVVTHNSGADMTKLAMKEFRKVNRELLQQNKVGIVLPVHDEIILWCIEQIAKMMEESLVDCMIRIAEMVHVGIPGVVEAHIADSWAEK